LQARFGVTPHTAAHNYREEHTMKRHHIWVIVLVAITAVVLILMWSHAH
jgi:hypothetical protein